jgi:hypothetical protein
MYLLDTNVLSEIRRGERADANVRAWARETPSALFWLSCIVIMEIETGILLLERRDAPQAHVLRHWLEDQVLPAFDGRILDVDTAVARRCAALHVPDRRSYRDSLIAATASVNGLTVATRNVADFGFLDVPLVDPWGGPNPVG